MPTITVIEPTILDDSNSKLRVAAYCRVSSNSEDQLNSYTSQVTYYSHLLSDSETETLVDVYADKGITGTRDDKRDDFQRMMTDCRRGKIDRIYVKSISRFARNTRDCLQYSRELKSLGISIFFEEENLDTAIMTDEMLITIMGSLAQEESVSISQNMRWSVKKRMQAGIFKQSTPPFGYRMEHGKLVVFEKEAQIVRRIFEDFLSGKGMDKIAAELNSEGIETSKSGEKWRKPSIRYILTNEKYTGDSLLRKTFTADVFPYQVTRNKGEQEQYLIENSHASIVSHDEFESVKKLIAERQQAQKEQICYPLTQKLICSNCCAIYRRKIRNQKICWVCRVHDVRSADCPYTGFREEQIYDAFIRLFNKLQAHYKAILIPLQSSLLKLKSRSLAGNAKVMDIRKETAKLHEQAHVLASLRTKGYLTEDKFHAQNAEIERKLDRLRKELHRLTKSSEEDEVLDQLAEMIAYFQKRGDIMVDFEADTFAYLVQKIVVNNQHELEFHLLGNVKLTETI